MSDTADFAAAFAEATQDDEPISKEVNPVAEPEDSPAPAPKEQYRSIKTESDAKSTALADEYAAAHDAMDQQEETFAGQLAKAKADGKSEFSYNGKTYSAGLDNARSAPKAAPKAAPKLSRSSVSPESQMPEPRTDKPGRQPLKRPSMIQRMREGDKAIKGVL